MITLFSLSSVDMSQTVNFWFRKCKNVNVRVNKFRIHAQSTETLGNKFPSAFSYSNFRVEGHMSLVSSCCVSQQYKEEYLYQQGLIRLLSS